MLVSVTFILYSYPYYISEYILWYLVGREVGVVVSNIVAVVYLLVIHLLIAKVSGHIGLTSSFVN